MKSVLVIGLGRTGLHLAEQLQHLGNDVMVVDSDAALVERFAGRFTDSSICDCTNEAVVQSLGVDNFDVCFVTIGEDFQASLVITSLLKKHGARCLVCKACQDIQADLLKKLGADEVFYPEYEMAEKLAARYNADNILDFVPLTSEWSMYEIHVPTAWIGHTVAELEIRRRYHINIIAVRKDEQLNPNLAPDHSFKAGETIFVIGQAGTVFRLAARG